MGKSISNNFARAFLFFFIFFIAPALLGKGARETTLEEAISQAPIICSGEVVGCQFDKLKPDEKVKTNDRFFLGIKYRISEIFRDLPNKLKVGTEIEVPLKSNTCLIWEEEVRRENNVLIFSRGNKNPAESGGSFEERWEAPLNQKFILFLDEKLHHFGWAISPKPESEEVKKKIDQAMGLK